ncbi:DUF1778 domain-containing protein [Oceanospirillaceae bacterium ASx5O]|nr:DUF1778 domain-containing protein [Oceanospirillaceae bacterium ASx5O]
MTTKPQIKVRISQESKSWLDRRAQTEERSLSFLVEEALKKARKLEEIAA